MNCTKCGKEIENGSSLCETCSEVTTPPKKKLSKKLIAIIAVVVAAVILVVALASGETSSPNLGLTLAEFVDRYNSTVDSHLKNDSTVSVFEEVQDILKLDINYFVENGDSYTAENSSGMGFMVTMSENSDKIDSVSFLFSNELTYEQTEIMITVCKWVFESVVPDMGDEYYSQTLSQIVETGESKEGDYGYAWVKNDNSYGFLITAIA